MTYNDALKQMVRCWEQHNAQGGEASEVRDLVANLTHSSDRDTIVAAHEAEPATAQFALEGSRRPTGDAVMISNEYKHKFTNDQNVKLLVEWKGMPAGTCGVVYAPYMHEPKYLVDFDGKRRTIAEHLLEAR